MLHCHRIRSLMEPSCLLLCLQRRRLKRDGWSSALCPADVGGELTPPEESAAAPSYQQCLATGCVCDSTRPALLSLLCPPSKPWKPTETITQQHLWLMERRPPPPRPLPPNLTEQCRRSSLSCFQSRLFVVLALCWL